MLILVKGDERDAYNIGWMAFGARRRDDEDGEPPCPYREGTDDRERWLDGFYDAAEAAGFYVEEDGCGAG